MADEPKVVKIGGVAYVAVRTAQGKPEMFDPRGFTSVTMPLDLAGYARVSGSKAAVKTAHGLHISTRHEYDELVEVLSDAAIAQGAMDVCASAPTQPPNA